MNTIFRNVMRHASRNWCKLEVSVPFPSATSQRIPGLLSQPVIGNLGIVQSMSLHELHTKGDQELLNFLTKEIVTEKKIQKSTLPTSLDGFIISTDESNVTFTKNFNQEEIALSLNVNHSIDADPSEDPNITQNKEEGITGMHSRPNFEVDIKKGSQTLTFSCSFVREDGPPVDPQQEFDDLFSVDEITLFERDLQDKVYVVPGDILDGYLYDLFMNMLGERGVTNEFVKKLSVYCTDYEHQLYINFLQKLEGFVGPN